MADSTQARIADRLRSVRSHESYMALLVCMAVVVTAFVAFGLMRNARAMNRQETIPNSHHVGNAASISTIPNLPAKNVRLKNVSSGNSNTVLSGATFELYAAEDYDSQQNQLHEGASPLVSGGTEDTGMLSLGSLQAGDYVLIETRAPRGYKTLIEPVGIHIDTAITYMQSHNDKVATELIDEQDGTTWYEIEVWNNPGIILPRSGGPGTAAYGTLGSLLIAIAGTALLVKRRTLTRA